MWSRSVAAWLLILTSYFAVQVAAGSYSHAYDKIWLYYAYNLAWKLEGSSQKYILRLLDLTVPADRQQNNDAINKGNRGSLPDGQLTWKEFQTTINWVPREKIPGPPHLSDDFDTLARQMWSTDWMTKAIKLPVAQSMRVERHQTPAGFLEYSAYIHKLADMVESAETRLYRNEPDIADLVDKLHTLGGKIVKIRSLEFRQSKYVGKDLRTVFEGIDIHEYEVPNPDPRYANDPSRNFKLVDTWKTLQDPLSQVAIKSALGLEGDTSDQWKLKFIDRVNGYGMTEWGKDKASPPYDKAAVAHGKSLMAWHRVFAVSAMANC